MAYADAFSFIKMKLIRAAFLLMIFSGLMSLCSSDLIITDDDDGYSTQTSVQDNHQELKASHSPLSGKVLRILVVHYPPVMIITRHPDGTVEYNGVAKEMLNYIAKALNVRKVLFYELVFLNPEDYKKFGYRPAQANAMKNGDADIAPGGVSSSITVYDKCDVSIPWLIQPYRMIVPWPEEQHNNDIIAAARPFDSLVWICLGVSVVAMACVLTCLSVLYEKYVDKGDEAAAAAVEPIDSNSPPSADGRQQMQISALNSNEKTNPVKNRSLASQKKVTTVPPKLQSSETSEIIMNANTEDKSVEMSSALILSTISTSAVVENPINRASNSVLLVLEDTVADDTSKSSPSIFNNQTNQSQTKTKHHRYPEPILNLIQEDTNSLEEGKDGIDTFKPTRRHQPNRVASSLVQHYAVVIHSESTSNSIQYGTNNSSSRWSSENENQTQSFESSKEYISGKETGSVVPSEMRNNAPLAAVHRPFVMQDFTFNFLIRNILFVFSHLASCSFEMRMNLHMGILIAVGIWCLMVVVLANFYAAILLSFLSVTKLGPVINTLEELSKSTSCQLLIQAGSDVETNFLNAKNGTYKLIGDSLRKHPDNLIKKFDRDVVSKEKLMNGSHALVHIDIVNYGLIDATYRQSGKKCRMTLAKETVGYPPFVVALFAKNSPYTEAYNKQLQRQIEAGLIDYNVKKSMPRIDQCKMENQKGSADYEPLTLWGMSSAFMVLILGASLATLAFLVELVYKRWMHLYTVDSLLNIHRI